MSRVWSSPSLTALEIAWRWLPLLLVESFLEIVEHTLGIGVYVPANTWSALHGFQSISIFQPAAAVQIIGVAVASVFPHSLTEARGFIIPLLLWNLIAALGRTLVLRRLEPTLHARRLSLFFLGTLRTLCLTAAWALWLWLVVTASRIAITNPAAQGAEPSLVLFAAMLIVGTLALYCLWAIVSWPLQLAPLLAMRNNLGALAALRAAITSAKDLRAKLIEINLVMNIVKLALIVLAMVFSASPLPFTSVATPEFLRLWWAGVILLYLAMSDYFHVVRAAAYLSLHRALTSTE
jgi:hypothetical protein